MNDMFKPSTQLTIDLTDAKKFRDFLDSELFGSFSKELRKQISEFDRQSIDTYGVIDEMTEIILALCEKHKESFNYKGDHAGLRAITPATVLFIIASVIKANEDIVFIWQGTSKNKAFQSAMEHLNSADKRKACLMGTEQLYNESTQSFEQVVRVAYKSAMLSYGLELVKQ